VEILTMFRTLGHTLALLLLAALPLRAADPYSIKVTDNTSVPAEVPEAVGKLLSTRCVQFLDSAGQPILEFWPRKQVPVKATEEQIKNGLTYREIPESAILGAVRLVKQGSDYRKQKVPPGVYTLRLGAQPMDGDHMGTAPYSDFALLCPAKDDKNPGTMEAKALHELSAKTTNSHPGVWLLFPGTGAGPMPKLVNKGTGHWVLLYQTDIDAGGKKGTMSFGLTLVGVSPQA
jgi:hypothetical protein